MIAQLVKRACRITGFAAILAIGASASAHAEDLLVTSMKYSNNGGYTAILFVRYDLADGTKCKVKRKSAEHIPVGQSMAVNLLARDFWVAGGTKHCLTDGKLPTDVEVWGLVDIYDGENKSCRSDSTKLFVGSDFEQVYYRTSGTTFHNNRCKKNFP